MELADAELLSKNLKTASFLSNNTTEEGKWTEKDSAWQVGCTLLALVCGQNPF